MSEYTTATETELKENPYMKSIEPLAQGILNIYQPSLVQVEKQLKELTDKQLTLLNQIHNENLNLSGVQYNYDLQEMFTKLKIYQSKLVNIKKELKSLHEKSIKLKKRALKLQQLKEKDEYIKKQKEVELRKEEELIKH